jgi:hypothetical protein
MPSDFADTVIFASSVRFTLPRLQLSDRPAPID